MQLIICLLLLQKLKYSVIIVTIHVYASFVPLLVLCFEYLKFSLFFSFLMHTYCHTLLGNVAALVCIYLQIQSQVLIA